MGASASKHFQRALGSSAKTNKSLRKNKRMDMRKLGVLPRGSNALEATDGYLMKIADRPWMLTKCLAMF